MSRLEAPTFGTLGSGILLRPTSSMAQASLSTVPGLTFSLDSYLPHGPGQPLDPGYARKNGLTFFM